MGSLLAEVELSTGSTDSASARLEHDYALGCQFGDPCLEGLSCRGIGLLKAQRGDTEGAVAHFERALGRVSEASDVYVWLQAWILDTLCEWDSSERLPDWSSALTELAAHTGMREWSVHACLRRATAGDVQAVQTARILMGSVENPSLRARVDSFALVPA